MTERAKLAQDFHNQGYNCAQAVVCAYCDLVGLDRETAYKMAGRLRLWYGLHGDVRCAERCVHARGHEEQRRTGSGRASDQGSDLIRSTKCSRRSFEQKNGRVSVPRPQGVADGNVRRSCPGCIEDACELIEEYLTK